MTTSRISSKIGDDPCSNSGEALPATQGFCFATIRRYKYPSEYMGWSVEHDSPLWTSDRLSAAPVPLEILMSELNRVAVLEPNVWAVVFPTNTPKP
jgi:hypothetical protein